MTDHADDGFAPINDLGKAAGSTRTTDDGTDEIDKATEAAETLSADIERNLRAFRGQFARLSDAILEHTEKVRRGEFEEVELGTILKKFDPVLNLSLQQEMKLNDKLAERVGKAGKFAIDFGEARSEIGRRLARLRRTGGADPVS